MTSTNRLIVALLSVLILLVAGNGFLVWRADDRAREDAERQRCLQDAQASAVIAVLAPALAAPDEVDREAAVQGIRGLSEQLDAC